MITILSGSPRKNSNTLRVAKAIQLYCHEIVPDKEISLIDFNAYDIPFINQGEIETHNLTDFQSNLLNSLTKSNLVFILTPEYNWFPSAEIINMIHQLANEKNKSLFDNKIFALAGISAGRGGRIPAIQLTSVLNKIIGFFSMHSFVSGKIFESQFTPKALDEHGNSMGNLDYDKGLKDFVLYSLKVSKK